ncbi:MAG: peptide chain release factor N(5)-glutamine methyltransferase [Lachnospiraceae bacterium]|nr:peptide chain release factor N(5)-glutamine methyltransferase [Lachnospiraceae bacterium]
METWAQILASGQKQLQDAGIAEYNLDAWYLFEHAFGISRMQYFMCSVQKAEPTEEALKEFQDGIARRAKREPLQHILGTQEFMGLEFEVNRHTLIPRQDTETLVELVLAEHKEKDIKLLDMCTGSGCIAISLAVHGGYAHVEAADISTEALKVAEKNGKNLLSEREIRFRHSDLFSAFDQSADKFDIIVSNPPYIPSDVIEELEPEVRDFEPRSALDGTADGLFFYEKLAEECGRFLRENGSVYFEIGHDQGEAVEDLLRTHGFKDTKTIKDLAGNDRVVCGRWQSV